MSVTKRLASVIVRTLVPFVPAPSRARWREEWLGEIDAAAPGRELLWRACGSWRDVLACRRLMPAPRRETPVFGLRGIADDVRYSARAISRSPGFTLAAVASLSIGIAATTTAFSAVNALLLRSLPGVADSTRLVHVFTVAAWLGGGMSSERSYQHYKDSLTSFSDLTAYSTVEVAIGTPGEPAVGTAVLVAPNYFSVLGTTAAAGRLLQEADGTQPLVVVSHDFAVSHFGSPAAAIGQVVPVNGLPLDIAGVAPRSFVGVRVTGLGESASRPQLWAPRSLRTMLLAPRADLINRSAPGDGTWISLVGRLRPGVSIAQAQAQAASVPPHIPSGTRGEARAQITPLGRGPYDSTADVAIVVGLALGIPFIVLAIGCANAANLQLARAARRSAEIAVMRSLGAPRGAIVRQLLLESLMVAGIAGTLAVLGSVWTTSLLDGFMPVPSPVDWRVLAFALGTVLITGVAFGIVPALRATRGDLTAPLKDSAGTALHGRSRLRGGLIVSQVALSILLLVLAGLFSRTLQRLHGVGSERDVSHLAAASMDLSLLKYSDARGRQFQKDLLARLEATPGVVAASVVPVAPFSRAPGLTYRTAQHTGRIPYRYTNGGAPLGRFIEAAGLRVVRGRGFTEEDRQGIPKVALVSETLARQMALPGDPVGQRVLVGDGDIPKIEVEIVGITADVPLWAVRADPQAMFLPSPLSYDARFSVWVRTHNDPALILPTIREIARELDPRLPMQRLGTAESWRDDETAPIRWIASGLGLMGLLALLLAGAGLYAVMSYLVASRRHEMAVRVALGARPRDLSSLIVGQAVRLAIPGLVLGGVLAAGAARVARAMLFGVSPVDPLALGGVSLLLLVVAIAATLAPALRAARLDPLATLRRQ
jgi:putative ABC transport system permease protein